MNPCTLSEEYFRSLGRLQVINEAARPAPGHTERRAMLENRRARFSSPPPSGCRAWKAESLRLACAALVLCTLAGWADVEGGGDCSQTTVGLTPLTDLGLGTYLGFEGGLYPGGGNLRPEAHEIAADTLARVALLDAGGSADPVNGQIVLLTLGMSNTAIESTAFIEMANADAGRNSQVVVVNGAQGGWDAARVADPTENSSYWATVDQRLADSGVTPLQVQAVWLKQAKASPTQSFPADAQLLQSHLEEIVRIIQDRYPNTKQVYNSSRIYAGYATTALNPEPFAYQAGFAVKWMIQGQLDGAPGLNFDPANGPVEAAWLAWGPYLWADGLDQRSDGLTWECADLANDGTHPSSSGSAKVASLLLDFFQNDPLASRWYVDCDPNSAGAFSVPPRVLGLDVRIDSVNGIELRWESLGPVAGSGTLHDVVTGSVGELRQTGFAGATCAVAGTPDAGVSDPTSDPQPGDGIYFLVRGHNVCGDGTWSEPGALPSPREALDLASPCPGSP